MEVHVELQHMPPTHATLVHWGFVVQVLPFGRPTHLPAWQVPVWQSLPTRHATQAPLPSQRSAPPAALQAVRAWAGAPPHTFWMHVAIMQVPALGHPVGEVQPTHWPEPLQTPAVPHDRPDATGVVTTAMLTHESVTQGFVLVGVSVGSFTSVGCPATHCSVVQSPCVLTYPGTVTPFMGTWVHLPVATAQVSVVQGLLSSQAAFDVQPPVEPPVPGPVELLVPVEPPVPPAGLK
jgi:hypothetical protein